MNAYPQIDLSAWTKVGEGGNSEAYINEAEPGILLRVNVNDTSEKAIREDFYTPKAVAETGIPTPEIFEIVRAGKYFGVKCRAVAGKKSFSRLCADDPASIDALGARMAALTKEFHAKTVQDSEWIPSRKEQLQEAARTTTLVRGKTKEKLLEVVNNIPESNHLLHGDLQTGNLIMVDGKPYWIDLGRASHGVPQFDLGHLYLFCNLFGRTARVQEIAHMTDKQLMQFWNAFASAYNGPDKMDEFLSECRRYAALDIIYLGMVQKLTFTNRLFLGALFKKLF